MDRVMDKIQNKANTENVTVESRCEYMTVHSTILKILFLKFFVIKCQRKKV